MRKPVARPSRYSLLVTRYSVVVLLATAGALALAQSPSPAFRHQRVIVPGAPGPNRLLLDLAVVEHGQPFTVTERGVEPGAKTVAERGMGDLRIYDAGGREVPYLVVPPALEEPEWMTGRLVRVASTKKTSGFEADLGEILEVDRLRLEGLPAPFLKRVRLEASGDRAHWMLLVDEGTLFDLPDEQLERTDLEFTPTLLRYLRVTWDDTSSARVPLPASASARLVLPESAPPTLGAAVAFEARASEPGRSRYRLHLPAPRLPVVAIELVSSGGNVLREARITETRLSGGEASPVLLGSAVLRRAVRGELEAAALRVPIKPPTQAELELTIDDGDNPPLSLTGISAIFAELPWIYFESADGKPLVARFGDSRLSAPRYDLEAARDTIAKLAPARAVWGELRETAPAAPAPDTGRVPAEGAPIDPTLFKYERRIPPGRLGLTALRLDAAVLAHSRFSDLRIVAEDGRQVPYLVEKLEEPLSVDLPALEKSAPPGGGRGPEQGTPGAHSVYRVRLPYPHLPRARLILTTPGRVFERRVSLVVERKPAAGRREPPTETVGAETWRHTDPETSAPALTLPVPPLDTTDAFLVVDEGDNAPLPLDPPRLLLPAYRLRFYRPTPGPLAFVYGRDDLEAPRYDLTLLASRVMGAAAQEVSADPERQPPPARLVTPTLIFWVVIGAAVVVLLLLVARLVGKAQAGS